jgi:two-component system, response regulator FlrC
MRVLIVGSLGGQLTSAVKIARDKGAQVTCCDSTDQAMQFLRAGKGGDLLMVDVDLDIANLVVALDAERIVTPVIACGVNTDAKTAADAIRAGAKEFIPLPPDAELIGAVLAAVSDDDRPMIARDAAMLNVVKLADQIAGSDASVLITGESGVGKEVMARYVHRRSRRAEKPFVSVNCAAIPENLLESELFGHEKGAFTGAIARRIGKFEEANGGTLLLDEVSEMDTRLQAKLLRALQERVIDRVGGAQPVPVDIRVLATSNRDLRAAVRAGDFREDLLYRLEVVNLRIPPLRERKSDIATLADFFVEKYAKANGVGPRRLSVLARNRIENMNWRGNVRELENTMHRAVILSPESEIGPDAIRMPDGEVVGVSTAATDGVARAAASAEAVARTFVGRTLDDMEQEMILATLEHCLGNRTHAANILGLSIRALRNKLKAYNESGIAVPPPPNVSAA